MENGLEFNDDGSFTIGVPILKINTEKRIVEGFATLNNVDQSKEIVEADASQEAFSSWIGNIREMHEKKAVGKAIDFYPDSYEDPDTGVSYDGMWVKAKISKGAEDTWQKVLDGTLAGFSIGGATLAKEKDIIKNGDGTSDQVWRITKYRLTELSLVDNPCNGLARVSLVKSVDGVTVIDDTVETTMTLNKSYNGETGEFVDLTPALKGVVSALENWRDTAISNNADYEASRASELLASARSRVRSENQDAKYYSNITKSEEGVTVTEKNENVDESLQNNDNSDKSILEGLSTEDKGLLRKFIDFVKSAPVVELNEENKEKDGVEPEMNTEDVTKAITEAGEELSKSVEGKFDQVGESLTKIADLLEKVATVEVVDELKKELNEAVAAIAERVEALETTGAVQKSGDGEGTGSEKLEKSEEGFWGGNVLPDYLVK